MNGVDKCEYCKKPIVDKAYIYLWQPEISKYRPVHTAHIKMKGEAQPHDIQTTYYS